jgi:putative membrane protein
VSATDGAGAHRGPDAGGAGGAPVDVDLAGADWRRMHPVTPALRGWKTLVVVLAVGWYQLGDQVRDARGLAEHGHWLIVVAAVAAIVLVASAYATLAWRVTRFTVTDEAVHLNTGVLFRQHRQARLDRLQAVDVVQPLLARLVGLAELKLDVAGGSGSNVTLSYLREAEALALRAELLALAAGLRRPAAASDAPVAPAPGAPTPGAPTPGAPPPGAPAPVPAAPAAPRTRAAPRSRRRPSARSTRCPCPASSRRRSARAVRSRSSSSS